MDGDGSDQGLAELQGIYPGAEEVTEGGLRYIHIPKLRLPSGPEVEALLRPGPAPIDGYTTRLLLSSPVPGKGANWSVCRILDRTWHTWSWNNVPAGDRLAQILANHLMALR